MTSTSEPNVRVVTISATYGAGGSVIAPALAAALKMDFFDRLVHPDNSPSVDTIMERLSLEEREQSPPGRIFASLSSLSSTIGLPVMSLDDMDPRISLRRQVENSVQRIGAEGGVVLGRAAAVVLADHPRSFHVRLHGPPDRCILQGMAIEDVSHAVARTHQADTDKSWSRFVSRLFDRDPADPKLYHLMVDSTAVPMNACVDLIGRAATAFWERPDRAD